MLLFFVGFDVANMYIQNVLLICKLFIADTAGTYLLIASGQGHLARALALLLVAASDCDQGCRVRVSKFSSTPARSRSRLQHFSIISFLVKMGT